MLRDPTIGVQGAEPQKRNRLKSNTSREDRDEISRLSAQYLQKRVSSVDLKNRAQELEMAQKRGDLVEKGFVKLQATYLLIAMRQKLLNLGSSHAHRFVGLTDIHEARTLLREIGINCLNELKNLPEAITDPAWAAKLEMEQEQEKG